MSRLSDAQASTIHAEEGTSFLSIVNRFVVQPLLAIHRGRVAHRELMALDDRQLADIGLRRSEITLALTAPHRIASRRMDATRTPANANEGARSAA
jgi:uncharacterized protein YjiS (DUF1127 family)